MEEAFILGVMQTQRDYTFYVIRSRRPQEFRTKYTEDDVLQITNAAV